MAKMTPSASAPPAPLVAYPTPAPIAANVGTAKIETRTNLWRASSQDSGVDESLALLLVRELNRGFRSSRQKQASLIDANEGAKKP